MKIKRYVAADIRQAIRMVRDDQGPDAVIVSNKRVNGGVELVAAINHQQSITTNVPKLKPIKIQNQIIPKLPTTAPGQFISRFENTQSLTHQPSTIEDSQTSDALQQVKNEIKMLRGMLENRLISSNGVNTQVQNPKRVELVKRLVNLNLSADMSKRIVADIDSGLSHDLAWQTALVRWAKKIPVRSDRDFMQGGVIAILGATGVGKTTSIAKIASRFAMKHDPQQIILVTTDNYRIGGKEQLEVHANILGIHLHIVKNQFELENIIDRASVNQLILIDTPSIRTRHVNPIQQFGFLTKSSVKIKSYLVLSATAQSSDLDEIVNAFGKINLQGCILTKLDECTRLGGVLSVTAKNRLPIVYTSAGPRVPEDLQQAVAAKLVSQCVALARYSRVQFAEEQLALEFGESINDTSN